MQITCKTRRKGAKWLAECYHGLTLMQRVEFDTKAKAFAAVVTWRAQVAS